jgi:molybdopterin synthase catalytic subunit
MSDPDQHHEHHHHEHHHHNAHQHKKDTLDPSIPRKDVVKVQEDKLDLEQICALVRCDEAGAISTFSGTTKSIFNGKKVLKLEYEAYVPMAEKEMKKICDKIRSKWDVVHIAIYHKIGEVPIGQTSVIIAISSVHRSDSLEAVHYAIDELKATVPVWKREYYEDGSVWKENEEWRKTHKC